MATFKSSFIGSRKLVADGGGARAGVAQIEVINSEVHDRRYNDIDEKPFLPAAFFTVATGWLIDRFVAVLLYIVHWLTVTNAKLSVKYTPRTPTRC